MTVLVLGAGVIGLTSALELARDGHDVKIGYRDRTPETTSDVAAAFHYPFLAEPRAKVKSWGKASLPRWGELSQVDGTGVTWGDVLELHDEPFDGAWWTNMVEHVDPAPDAVLPESAEHGTLARVPIMDMRSLMPWLEARAEQAGVRFKQGDLEEWSQMDPDWEAIVNCTGLGARDLLGDDELVPVRGQVVYVEDPGLERAVLDQRDPDRLTYIVPFGDRCVLGGTAEEGVEEATTDPATIDRILARCRALEPRLEDAEVLGSAAGLRPHRSKIRLETVTDARLGPIIHNYGHGGAGVTLAWGCAAEVVQLVGRAVRGEEDGAEPEPEPELGGT